MDQHPAPRKPCYFILFVIAILILTTPRSGVLLAAAQDDLAHGGKGVDAGANGTQTSEIGRSNVTVRIDCGPGHGGGNGYGGVGGGGGYHSGGNGYGKPWTTVPQGHYPMTVKGSADHGNGLWATGYCVLLAGTTSWLLIRL